MRGGLRGEVVARDHVIHHPHVTLSPHLHLRDLRGGGGGERGSAGMERRRMLGQAARYAQFSKELMRTKKGIVSRACEPILRDNKSRASQPKFL